jgi:uncharacterized membrane protein affecting hemolysin expression
MTEYLLAIVTIIAAWKIMQVWMLKRKLKRTQALASATIMRAIDDTNKLAERVDAFCPDEVLEESVAKTEEWPAEIE